MYRGRLVFPHVADIRRYDPAETKAKTPVMYPHTDAMDDVFNEPVKLENADGPVGTSPRAELAPVLIPCQYEAKVQDQIKETPSGDDSQYDIRLILHRNDLLRLGLVDSGGAPTLRKRDRLARILDKQGNDVLTFGDHPDGMYVEQVEPESFGLGFGSRVGGWNIVRATLRRERRSN